MKMPFGLVVIVTRNRNLDRPSLFGIDQEKIDYDYDQDHDYDWDPMGL